MIMKKHLTSFYEKIIIILFILQFCVLVTCDFNDFYKIVMLIAFVGLYSLVMRTNIGKKVLRYFNDIV